MAPPKKKKGGDDGDGEGKMSGAEKAALLLNTLGNDATSAIFKGLKDNDVRRLITLMGKTKRANVNAIKGVMMEFYRALNEENEIIFGNGDARDSIIKSLGEDRARLIFGAAGAQAQQKSLEALEMVDTRTLANYLTSEHPQTVALVVAHLPPEKKSDVVKRLPEAMQGEVILRMSNLDYISPELLEQVDEVLKQGLAMMGTMETTQLGGVEPVAEMFNLLDKNTEQSIMSRVEEKDPLLAEEIRRLMFVFDDLTKVDDKGLGLILKEVNNESLLKALKSAPEPVREKIFRNMSKRGAEMIKNDLETMGPIRVSDVEAAQQQIVGIARRLEEEGKLFIERGGDGDGLV
ncbi:MAG: flagellar motor switch protein FliG [Bdellovibrionales bacterium]|nr:flagellar motor switch protein FliG [Bdellovibrionales bacterium]